MLTDRQCCEYAAATYGSSENWDHVWQGDEIDNFYACLKKLPDCDVISCRGSFTLIDWIHDGDAIPVLYEPFGYVHSGFFKGAVEAYADIKPSITKPVVLDGHSLGGAHAQILAGLFLRDNIEVSQVCTFGSPKVGYQKFADFIKPIENVRLYKNGPDFVTDAPLTILPDFPFLHARSLTPINVLPMKNEISLFAFHHIDLYMRGMPNGRTPT